MAYTAGGLSLISSVNGFGLYRYDSTDDHATVDTAGYFNNVDDSLNLRVGDVIEVVEWSVVRTGTITDVSRMVVTNVIANDAAASAGNVNLSGDMYRGGLVSSSD